jgi:flagellar biosynthesis regulator FlbT
MEIPEINKSMISAHGVKVSVGCRITAARKMFLEEEARKKDAKSFSEFLESILNAFGNEKNEVLKKELSGIAGNEDLQKMFKAYKGKRLTYQMPSGENRTIEVNSLSDLIKALVETVFDKN